MNKKHANSTTLLLAMTFAACGGTGGLDISSKEAGLSASYVSGHLGTNRECPALNSPLQQPAGGAKAACSRPVGSSDSSACGPDPCFNGAMLVEIANISDHEVDPRVEKIELLDQSSANPTQLSIVEVATTDGKTLDKIAVGARVTVRILFPAQSRFSSNNATGKVRATIAGDGEHTIEILSPGLQFLPPIAT